MPIFTPLIIAGMVLMLGGLATIIVFRISGWIRASREKKGLHDIKARFDDVRFTDLRGDTVLRMHELNGIRIGVFASLIGLILFVVGNVIAGN